VALSRILAAWVAVAVWFVLWEAATRGAWRGGTGPWLRAPLWHYAGEALALTLLGTLWFASLGSGAWWLVFALIGVVAAWHPPEGARRTRRRASRELIGRALGVCRVLVAGGILAWTLGTT
jgi:hypothetical protein